MVILYLLWWYHALGCSIIGSAGFDVKLSAPSFAAVGGSALLKCDYTVPADMLHKVEWLKNSTKFFQYVKERKPPFRNFTLTGATIDWTESSERQVMLRDLDLDATGLYSCEVSTDTPIFTKSSDYHEITVMEGQKEAPRITFGKLVYTVGEKLHVNCSSGPTKPQPHLTWLINGKQAEPNLVRNYKGHTAELRIKIKKEHLRVLHLTCLSTIPAYMGDDWKDMRIYADHRSYSVSVHVLPNTSLTEPEIRVSSSGPMMSCSSAVIGGPSAFPLLFLLIFSTASN
ncbi:uncharacterized protein [Rhodnius prolixus]|uniref:uncharacterized protein n=1 Tax=Rhodnius prolixus TaxID=13249 RepID=UPI003D18D920